jgi:5-methylcytosine-specific restriction endonuclease McrA
MMSQWASKHLGEQRTTRRRLRHTRCGHLAEPVLTCSHCGEVLSGSDLEPVVLTVVDDATAADAPARAVPSGPVN